MLLAVCLIIAYLIGTLPTGYLVAKSKKIDLSQIGSGNIGATNVSRALGFKTGLLVLIFDVVKAAFAVFLCQHFVPIVWAPYIAALLVLLGNVFNPFLHWKGGKGVASASGVMLMLFPLPTLIAIILFIIIVVISKYVSLGSILGVMSIPITVWVMNKFHAKETFKYDLKFSLLILVLVIITHRSNIKRLFKGDENKFTGKKQ